MEGKLNSEQQRREMKEAALKEQLESERAARELQRRELSAVLNRERQAFERLTVLERSILSVEELARREMEVRARESRRLWDALDQLRPETKSVRTPTAVALLRRGSDAMPRIRTLATKKAPEGWEDVAPQLEEFANQMRDAVNEPHEGKRRNEAMHANAAGLQGQVAAAIAD
eukprot:g16472.t1